jgi:hypothetical protein
VTGLARWSLDGCSPALRRGFLLAPTHQKASSSVPERHLHTLDQPFQQSARCAEYMTSRFSLPTTLQSLPIAIRKKASAVDAASADCCWMPMRWRAIRCEGNVTTHGLQLEGNAMKCGRETCRCGILRFNCASWSFRVLPA